MTTPIHDWLRDEQFVAQTDGYRTAPDFGSEIDASTIRSLK